MFAPVYFDHNATTQLDWRVLKDMLPYLRERFGNASSRHEYGRQARKAVDEARQQVAVAVGAHPTEVIFTSGGSEANNLFLKGAAACMRQSASLQLATPLVAISAIEHPSVRETAQDLQRQGWQLREIAVDSLGQIAGDDYVDVLKLKPRLLSLMLANNETGAIQDISALAEQARAAGASWFHCDAVQACGKLPLDFRALNATGVHALTISAHKIGGPLGAGALVLDKRVELRPLISGGGQERGLRSGTENLAAIVGFGRACSLLAERLVEVPRLAALRDALEAGLVQQGATIFGRAEDKSKSENESTERLSNTTFFALPGIDGETLVGKLDRAGFAVASGSACSSAEPEPSHVLRAMGVVPDMARGAVRISLGAGNTAKQVTDFLAVLGDMLFQLRRLTALAG